MNKDKIRRFNEVEDNQKEVLDSFRKMKLMYDYARFKLHKLQVENLINDYEQLRSYVKKSKSKS